MIIDEIRQLIANNPDIGKCGFLHPDESPFNVDNSSDFIEIVVAIAGLAVWPESDCDEEISPSSYGVKHIIERAFNRYVPNGAVLLAARHLGISMTRYNDTSPNAYMGLVPAKENDLLMSDETFADFKNYLRDEFGIEDRVEIDTRDTLKSARRQDEYDTLVGIFGYFPTAYPTFR